MPKGVYPRKRKKKVALRSQAVTIEAQVNTIQQLRIDNADLRAQLDQTKHKLKTMTELARDILRSG